ncbi:MAG: hypothetical protein RDV48_15565 [Candidatus Eremiobacteraeota bacterium]|nr:hypothetical protein [Candidatus Eremiobacteraeota bacterium]
MKHTTFKRAYYLAVIAFGLLIALTSCGRKADENVSVTGNPTNTVEENILKAPLDDTSSVAEMLKSSSGKKKFLVVLFFEKDDEPTGKMKSVYKEAENKYGKETAHFVTVNVNDEKELPVVRKYEIDKVNKPVLLVLSPEGTVINGFVEDVSVSAIKESFLSEKVLSFLKSAQERRLIFVCFPGQDSAQFEKAMKEVDGYASKKENSVVIRVDPEDKNDMPLFSMFKMAPGKAPQTAVTILNQGALAGTLKGTVDSAKIDALLSSCSNCSSG